MTIQAFCQSNEITLELKVEGFAVKIKENFSVKVVTEKDTFILKITEKGFFIPDSLIKKKRTIIFKINQFELPCETFLTYQEGYPHWTINIDFRPISEENRWLIKKAKKRIYWLYTLNKSDQFLLTYYRFKQFVPINK